MTCIIKQPREVTRQRNTGPRKGHSLSEFFYQNRIETRKFEQKWKQQILPYYLV